jgi:hypothetical protein
MFTLQILLEMLQHRDGEVLAQRAAPPPVD